MAYIVHGSAIQDTSNDIWWAAHVENEGVIETNPASCTVTLYESDGDNTVTAVSGATETVSGTPDSQGVYNGKLSGVSLTEGKIYYLEVTINADSSDRTSIVYLGVPVRTA